MNTTSTYGINLVIPLNGNATVSSNHPWYRFLSALVDLYLSGQISEDALTDEASAWTQAVHNCGDRAAIRLLGLISLPADEGAEDYRARLISILIFGGVRGATVN